MLLADRLHVQTDGFAEIRLGQRQLGQNRRQRPHDAVGVFDFAAAVREAVGLRLPGKATRGENALAALPVVELGHVVITHFGPARVAEDTGMDHREMRHVQKILDDARTAGGDIVRAAQDLAQIRIVVLRKRQHICGRRADADPDQAILFLDLKGKHACLHFFSDTRQSRNQGTTRTAVEMPAVISAHDLVTVNPSDRQARAAMRTAILPCAHIAVRRAPEHELAIEQPHRHQLPRRHSAGGGDWMPVVEQNAVFLHFNHAHSKNPDTA